MAEKAKRLGKDIMFIAIVALLVNFLFDLVSVELGYHPKGSSCIETLAPNGASAMNCRKGE